MNPVESFRMSVRAIRGHRLRSVLTTLGVAIGVAAVITFVTLGASLQADVIGEVSGDQPPLMTVSTGPADDQPGPPGESQAVFTEHDIEQLRAIEDTAAVVPQGTVPISGLAAGGRTLGYNRLTATTPESFEYVATSGFSDGTTFEQGTREVVVNEPAARLFPGNVSVGDTVAVVRQNGSRVNATVAGVLAAGEGPFGNEPLPQVYVPTDPFYETRLDAPSSDSPQRVYPTVTVVASEFSAVDAVQSDVQTYLDEDSDARTLKPGSYEFRVQTVEDLVDQIRELLDTFTAFVTGVAVISLVVGSIGIANIMLVSVTERTREIGIMKAVGAQNSDVLQLFIVEAVVLGVVGSLAGIVLGVLGAYAATEYVDLAMTFPVEWAGIAVVVGILVGVGAGLYPAWSAARTDPIEALRYE
ncbi:ABC transporter permease [Halobacterium jilantaiense]|uniref:Putative ABC transport system permease protein n=1 Tax=Halobacterium jilantaiense TaxID=355548 RepID=A0A1I0N6A4_9EURY|nr:ABC transporter permease [Halobacterium jilantaiense]SEV96322.1 putative ABC transport system permease protein [Halobacterium jilantaiense]